MNDQNDAVEMVFRTYKGEVIALFPYCFYNFQRYGADGVESYQHLGQHGLASYSGMMRCSKPAQPEEYQDLLQELKQIGYEVKILQRRSPARLKAILFDMNTR